MTHDDIGLEAQNENHSRVCFASFFEKRRPYIFFARNVWSEMLSFREDVCSICHNTVDVRKRTITRCNHRFCKACLDEWVASNQNFSCPICCEHLIEAKALFSMAEYRIKTIDNTRYLLVSFEREVSSPNWYYLGNLYSERADIAHDVRTVDGKEVVRLRLNGNAPRFVVLRQGFTPMNSLSQRAVSCADVFIDLQALALYRIRDDFTTEFMRRIGDVGTDEEFEVEIEETT